MYVSLINKYKASILDDINIDDVTKDIINLYINNNKLLFLINGGIGSGKTSLINVLLGLYYGNKKEIDKNIVYINLLKEQGISYYRNELKTYCQINNIKTNNKKKTIIFDDLDLLNDQCQQIFISYINTYENINFIISCTDMQKIKPTIIDKLEILKINNITNEFLKRIMKKIIKNENIEIDKDYYNKIIISSNFSISHLIYSIEKLEFISNKHNINDNTILDTLLNNILYVDLAKYIDNCKYNNIVNAVEIIKKIYDNGYSVIDILYSIFIYIKNYSDLNEEYKFLIIKIICKYVNFFHTIHEDPIELYFLTNNIINIFRKP